MNIVTTKFVNNLGDFRGYNLSIIIDNPIHMYRIQKHFNYVSVPEIKRSGHNFPPSYYNYEFINTEYNKFLTDNNIRATPAVFEEKDGVVIAIIRTRVWDNKDYEEKVEKDLELLIEYIKFKIDYEKVL